MVSKDIHVVGDTITKGAIFYTSFDNSNLPPSFTKERIFSIRRPNSPSWAKDERYLIDDPNQFILKEKGAMLRSWDVALQRQVAIKFKPPDIHSLPSFSEPRTISKFSHPNIPQVYDFFQLKTATGDTPSDFIVMQWIEGMSGADITIMFNEKNCLLPVETIEFIQDIGGALDHVHNQGFVHRDIRPANVIRQTTNSSWFLCDYDQTLTVDECNKLNDIDYAPGQIEFIAPELLYGISPPSIASDIFAFNSTVYNLLTGYNPFSDNLYTVPLKNTSTLSPKLYRESIYASRINNFPRHRLANLPHTYLWKLQQSTPLDNYFDRGLAKNPADRPTSIRDCIDELTSILK